MAESFSSIPGYPFSPCSHRLPDGHTLSYLDVGRGPVVVLLHGNPSWSFYYRNLALLLQKRYRVIVPDHLGCGLSDKPRNYRYCLQNHIDNLESLLKTLRVSKVSLVLHDWGGAIGMGYAVRHHEDIAALVVLNTAAFHSARIPWRIRICRTHLLGALLIRGFNVFAAAAIHLAVTKKMSAEIAGGYLFPYDCWKNRIATLRFVQDIPLSDKDLSWGVLAEIEEGLSFFRHTPMLICWGGRDFCFNDHYYREWRRRFPRAEAHHFADAGHYVLEDAGDRIGPLVEKFLEANAAQPDNF
ncbi:MAG: alpha/beta fold hydrolase [Deltaproteobacteria bacterium]|nr:alpha/beta fold hydrolase [Deltaproteobacteria bacterium]